MSDNLRFLKRFLSDPIATGSIAPSSRHLARTMVQDMGLSSASTVVELGPGTGAFTGVIAEAVGKDTLFLAIELNREFADDLRDRFPRATIINESAEHLVRLLQENQVDRAEAILCGLPWAGFPDELQRRLMKGVLSGLKPGGKFATFAYIHAAWLPAARRYRRLLESSFDIVETSHVVWRNVPPAFVYRCTR